MNSTTTPIDTLVYIDDTGARVSPGDRAMNAKQITDKLGRTVSNSGAAFYCARQPDNSLVDEIQVGLDHMENLGTITVVVAGDINEAEQTEIHERFPDVEILFATEFKKVAILVGWGDFSPELRGSMQDKLHEFYQLDNDVVVQGVVLGTLSRFPDKATPEGLHQMMELTLETYVTAQAGFDIVACYVVADMPVDIFADLAAPLAAIYDFPISLQPPSDLAA